MTRRRGRRRDTTEITRAPRQPNIKPGAVNFQPVKDTVINQMYQNFGPQSNQGYMFSPGAPIKPVAGITPPTGPRQYEYPVGYNISQLPRSTETYSFSDLRQLASMYYGVQMCEQVWFDYITKLEPIIEPREELMKDNQDESMYAEDIQRYKDFFAFPDRDHDLHTWMQMAVRDQLEIDAVAIYIRKDRAGRPYALDLLDASTIKPLVDDRGRRPFPPFPAYEQYIYGVPACFLTSDDLIYVKETDRLESVYGKSRVEKIILNVNVALRKQTKDLARFTDGTVPQGIIMPSVDVQWSQEEIEAYEIQFNNLMAGNDEMRARIKVLPRGFEYKPTDDPDVHIDLDTYLLNVTAANFGITMSELAFIADVNRSSGETQENVVYRRAMGPLMSRYAKLFTIILRKHFHEERFVFRWKGFEEVEDFTNKATAYSTLTTSGILSPSRAAHLLNLPVDVDLSSPYIQSKSGLIMLEDLADPQVREALKENLISGGAPAPAQTTDDSQEPDDGQKDDSGQDEEKPATKDQKPVKRLAESDGIESLLDSIEMHLRELRDSHMDRHNPGGDSHNQKTHGNWEHPNLGSKDKTLANKQNMQAKAAGKKHVTTSHANHSLKQKKTASTTKKTSGKSLEKALAALSRRAMSASRRFLALSEKKISKSWTQKQADAASSLMTLFSRLAKHLGSGESGSFAGIRSAILSQADAVYGKGSVHYASMVKLMDSLEARMDALRVDTPEEMDEEDELFPDDDTWIDAPENTGIMLAFFPDKRVAEEIALPGGVPVDQIHMTLAYLGDMQEVDLDVDALSSALSSWAKGQGPLTGRLAGVGRFAAEDDVNPIIALPDVPGLPAFRQSLVALLESLHVQVASDHGYTPHITLCYIPADEDLPFDRISPLPLRFDALVLAMGDECTSFPLGKGPSDVRAQAQELAKWKHKAIDDMRRGRAFRPFITDHLPPVIAQMVERELSGASDVDRVRAVFDGILLEPETVYTELGRWEKRALELIAQGERAAAPRSSHLSPFAIQQIDRGLFDATSPSDVSTLFTRARGSAALDTGSWQAIDDEVKHVLLDYAKRGVTELEWVVTSNKSTCTECLRNNGQRVKVGYPFPTGALTVTQHPNCACQVIEYRADGSSSMGDGIRKTARSETRVSKRGTCNCETCRERDGKPVGDRKPPYHEGCDCKTVEDEA